MKEATSASISYCLYKADFLSWAEFSNSIGPSIWASLEGDLHFRVQNANLSMSSIYLFDFACSLRYALTTRLLSSNSSHFETMGTGVGFSLTRDGDSVSIHKTPTDFHPDVGNASYSELCELSTVLFDDICGEIESVYPDIVNHAVYLEIIKPSGKPPLSA